jgi:PIN domain nuclease of toxin-antitoxin system
MILLDTHVLIWWIEGGGRLSQRATGVLEDKVKLVSPITFWELTVLVERGRIVVDRDVGQWCRDVLVAGSVRIASLTPSAAISAARLQDFHGDPADRFIYATARELNVPLVSKDEKIRAYAAQRGDVEVIW